MRERKMRGGGICQRRNSNTPLFLLLSGQEKEQGGRGKKGGERNGIEEEAETLEQ